MIELGIRQAMQLQCRVCRQPIDYMRADRTKIMAMLFGVAAYAVCPCCWQEPEDHRDRNYRARFRGFMKRARHGLTVDAPMASFTSPCGRAFEMRAGTFSPPRFKGDDLGVGIRWPIFFKDEPAGTISFDLMYDRKKPSYHGTPTKLYWRFASDAPDGVGFDISKCETLEEVIDRWTRRADEILDWYEGRPVSIWPSGRRRRVRCEGVLQSTAGSGGRSLFRCDRCNITQHDLDNLREGDQCPRHLVEKVTS